ncbi:hypothetical protein VZ17_004490 [Salmonella enterica subsp. enterica serovar Abaetetuba]|nr:hypothetical protein [Salmonella enterica subsp. enterica serovar Abaetetuba]
MSGVSVCYHRRPAVNEMVPPPVSGTLTGCFFMEKIIMQNVTLIGIDLGKL